MPKYKVTVERTVYQSAIVEVNAPTPEEAEVKVSDMIENAALEASTLEWSDGDMDETGIRTTGDVD